MCQEHFEIFFSTKCSTCFAFSCGIGGGHFAVHFDANTEKATFINGRETAPKSANETMFVNTTKDSELG